MLDVFISAEKLAKEKEIPTPIDITRYNDYHSFVVNNSSFQSNLVV